MNLSLSTILTCSVFLLPVCILLFLLYAKNDFCRYRQIRLLSGCSLLILLRLAIPLEFPFTKSVYLSYENLPFWFSSLHASRFFVFGKTVLLTQILALVWFLMSIIFFTRFFQKNRRFQKVLRIVPEIHSPVLEEAIQLLQHKRRHPAVFRFYQLPTQGTPFITGLFRPKIYLPDGKFTNEELRSIVLHEAMHYYRHDLWLKLLTEMLCILFWWNPLLYYLRKILYDLMELQTDAELIKYCSVSERADYASCLIKITRMAARPTYTVQLGLCDTRHSLLERRVRLLLQSSHKKPVTLKVRILSWLLPMGLVASLLFPTFIVLEPSTRNNVLNNTASFSLDGDSVYLITTNNGYYLYIDHQNVGFLENIPESFSGYPVYHSLEEVPKS